jgi:hypothetical protein
MSWCTKTNGSPPSGVLKNAPASAIFSRIGAALLQVRNHVQGQRSVLRGHNRDTWPLGIFSGGERRGP